MPASEVLILMLVKREIICRAALLLNLEPYDAFVNCAILGKKIEREHFSAHSYSCQKLAMGVPVPRGGGRAGEGQMDRRGAKRGLERAGLRGGFWNFAR